MEAPKPSAGDPSRERALFEAALDLDGDARAAFLEAHCGADAVLRDRIEALLEVADGEQCILPGVPVAAVASSPPPVTPHGTILERPGMTIDRYALLEEIGEGGCGVVYLAEQREPVRRRVALKILKPGMDTRSVVARFEAERQALALMDHPNIARVLDGGATQTGRPFFVMELVRGIRITDFCDERRLAARERLELFIQVCNAIQHAHQKGVIHRDIKPSNILVTVNDDVAVPKVIDFGIAKATGQPLTDKTLVTRFHGLIGTPAYMSPEQAEFSSVDIDTRSDVYSLGVLLYELLVGKPPFDSAEILKDGLEGVRRTLRNTPPTAPSVRLETFGEAERTHTAERRRCDVPRLRSDLKGDLDWIVLKCLEKDRVRRYESVGALAQDIQRSLHHEPIEARPPTWSYRLGKAVERNRVAFLTGTLLAVTLVVAAVFSTAMAVRERSARTAAERATARAESEALAARRAAYAADILSARAALEEGNPGRARALLSAYHPQPGEPDLRGLEWRWLSWAARDESMRVLSHPGLVRQLAMAPDGKRFASASTDGQVRIWDSQTLERLMEFRTGAEALAYSLDGRMLAAVTGEGTVLRRTDTWEVQRVIPGLGGPLIFALDGGHLFGVEGGRWVRWDLDGRERTVPASPIPDAAPEVAAAVGSDRIVVAAYAGPDRITVLSAVTGEGTLNLRGMDSVLSVAGSADGRWVAAGNWHGSVMVWDARTGERVAVREALRRGAEALAFSQDGAFLLSGGRDQQIRILRFEPGGGEPLREVGSLHGHSGDVVGLRFSPDGARVVSCSHDGTARVWEMAGRREHWGPRIPGLNSLIFDFNADATEFHTLVPEGEAVHWGGAPPQPVSRHRLPLVPLAVPLGVGDDSIFIGDRAGGLARWDLKRRSVLWRLQRGSAPLVPMAYSPISGILAVAEYGGMGRLHLHRLPATEPERTLEDFRGQFTEYTRMAALSPDGRWLAYPGPDHSVRVVDVASGALRANLAGLIWHVGAVAISPDNRRVVAGGNDGSLIVWDLASGRPELGPFRAHAAAVNHVEYSSDGKTVLTTAFAGGLRLWNASNGRSMISIPEAESTAAPLLAEGDQAVIFWNLKTADIERHPAPPLSHFDRPRR
jgi:serine/threonine protein kinase/WD40 repeat protein